MPSADTPGETVLATTGGAERWTAAALLPASPEPHTSVELGGRWRKPPAAMPPVWLEQPARMAALAMLTGVG